MMPSVKSSFLRRSGVRNARANAVSMVLLRLTRRELEGPDTYTPSATRVRAPLSGMWGQAGVMADLRHLTQSTKGMATLGEGVSTRVRNKENAKAPPQVSPKRRLSRSTEPQ